MVDKRFSLFVECPSRGKDPFPQEKNATLLLDGTVKCAHLAAQQIQRMPTELKKFC